MSNTDSAELLYSHEGGLAAPYVNIPDADAVALMKRHFGLTGTVLRYATEKDDTFRFDAVDGQHYVLKVANPSETEAELSFQIALLEHIAKVAPGLPVPRVRHNLAGEALFRVESAGNEPRFVRVMSYLTGTPLAQTSSLPHEREHIGEILAALRQATAAFSHPADSRVLAWDVRHLPMLRHLLQEVPDAKQRGVLEQAMNRFDTIAGRLEKCRMQVLHNDFNTNNIVVDHDAPNFVTGIIDFGDAVRTAIAADVSTALMNQLPRSGINNLSDDIFGNARDVLRGYLKVADLTDEELELIPHLAMARVVTRALLTTWRSQIFPKNSDYILRHTAPGWVHLDWFLCRSNDEISGLLLPPSL